MVGVAGQLPNVWPVARIICRISGLTPKYTLHEYVFAAESTAAGAASQTPLCGSLNAVAGDFQVTDLRFVTTLKSPANAHLIGTNSELIDQLGRSTTPRHVIKR